MYIVKLTHDIFLNKIILTYNNNQSIVQDICYMQTYICIQCTGILYMYTYFQWMSRFYSNIKKYFNNTGKKNIELFSIFTFYLNFDETNS